MTSRPAHILLVCDYRVDGPATVLDHIDALRSFSRHTVRVLSILGDLPDDLVLSRFDAVVIHYSLIASADGYLSPLARRRLRLFQGLKAIFVQDEYRWVNRFIDVIDYLGIDLLFTCVPEDEIEKVYPRARLPKLRKVSVLTGYVQERLTKMPAPDYHERRIDIGYRGRRLSAWFGDLGREKWLIVDRFKIDAVRYGLICDLSYREGARLHGEEWIRFIQSCRAVLGVESGANIFDFDGELQPKVERHEARHPDTPYEVLRDLYFAGLEGRVRMNQISPRCFEAAALRTLMILYEGEYSGILHPWQHYVPLRKDHSNVAEVVACLRDPERWREIVDRAYREIALNPQYGYACFAQRVDRALDEVLASVAMAPVDGYSDAEFKTLGAPSLVNQTRGRHRFDLRRLDALASAAAEKLFPAKIARYLLGAFRTTFRSAREVLDIMLLVGDFVSEFGVGPLMAILRLGRGSYAAVADIVLLRRLQSFGRRAQATTGGPALVVGWNASEGELVIGDPGTLRKQGPRLEILEPAAVATIIGNGRMRHLRLQSDDRWAMPGEIRDGRHLGAFCAFAALAPDTALRIFIAAGQPDWTKVETTQAPCVPTRASALR
jgi:glycosyl transferase family 1